MFIVNLPAGGWLEFHGKSPNTEIKVFNADGSPFKFEYQKNPRSMLLN
jgi:hypothetical protein